MQPAGIAPRVWQVGALCRAVADALDARFNPVAVRGEISGITRAFSGHGYFSLKDPTGQIRCVMFKRAFGLLDFSPRDGDLVEVRGRLALYEARGDLQMVVESIRQAGAGARFEQFLKLKAKLEVEGLFEPSRKRALPPMPRAIGVVTSLGAAALHDVVSALRRRVPHIPVVIAVAAVQGSGAPAELVKALAGLYRLCSPAAMDQHATRADGLRGSSESPMLDAILLVRGGGSIEDLWAFNDEALARAIARSPVPVISGVGHETDFSIADFVADLRAPTPTAAAELAAHSRDSWIEAVDTMQQRLHRALTRRLDQEAQRVDTAAAKLGRPSSRMAVQREALISRMRRMRLAIRTAMIEQKRSLQKFGDNVPGGLRRRVGDSRERLARAELRLGLLDPQLVLERGYAWLADEDGRTITCPAQVPPGSRVRATLARGTIELMVPRGD